MQGFYLACVRAMAMDLVIPHLNGIDVTAGVFHVCVGEAGVSKAL